MDEILYGQATTDDHHQIESILKVFLKERRNQATYRPVAVGITNSNWIVRENNNAYFIKLYGKNTHIMIDRSSSVVASRRSGELGVGPFLCETFQSLGAEIYEFLDGYKNSVPEDFSKSERRSVLLEKYKKMHNSASLPLTRTGYDQLEQRYSLLKDAGIAAPDNLAELIERCRTAAKVINATKPTLSPCHNDCYAPNFMLNDAGDVRIVDWEYASNNDPLWDLTMLSLAMQLPPEEVNWFAEYYGENIPPDSEAKATLYGGMIAVSWGVWALLQTQYSNIEFDYQAYSQMLLGLGDTMTQGEAWEAAKCQLS
tara:strand:- start:174 stop:1112 length:939 start_codon:yes stop_codon:yes gene_type:complete